MRPVGSGRSSTFDCSLTPWLREPLECANDGTREVDFIKPIQSGGSVVGECVLLWWLCHWARGDICMYWPTDSAADERWTKRIERILRACQPFMDLISADRHKFSKGLVALPALNLICRGAFTDKAVASDSFRGEVLEELHDEEGWTPGRMAQAAGRTTGYWDSIIYRISNAGIVGGELHGSWKKSTMQHWEVPCPGCGKFHFMHGKKDPTTGAGLLYSMEGQPEHAEPDYRKLEPTIRYRFECGYEMRDTLSERRKLSQGGRYSAPTNHQAPLTHRGFTLEAAAVHDIPWLQLVREKQTAWTARKSFGDPRLWQAYCRERECLFIDPLDRSEARALVLSPEKRKDRDGLPNRAYRFAACDYQEGIVSDHPHWWTMIMDFDADGNGLLVFEGRVETDGMLIEVMHRHNVPPQGVVLDSGYNTEHIYDLALSNGWSCLKAEGNKTYLHSDEMKRCYSEPEPLYPLARRMDPVSPDPAREPVFFLVSKFGALDLLNYQRTSKVRKWEVPGDVSEDFKTHFAAWTIEPHRRDAVSNVLEARWVKAGERTPDHLFICASYIAVLCDQAMLVGMPEQKDTKQ